MLVYSARTPDPPINLATVSASSTHITFNWIIPYNGGSPITFYQIFWDKGNGGAFSTFTELAVTLNPDNEFILDYGLTPGHVYQFAVKAVNIVGAGNASNPATFIAASLPSQPSAPYKVTTSTSSITIAWIAPADNGSPIINY